MHELSTMVRLVNLACERARLEGGEQILSIEISVGAMTGIMPYYLNHYFPEASKGTPAEGAVLKITEVPVTVTCLDCGKEYEPERERNRACPVCGSVRGKITGGRDVTVDRIILQNDIDKK